MSALTQYMLNRLGVPIELKGYRYLEQALDISLLVPFFLDNTTEVYKRLAADNGVNPKSVERVVGYACVRASAKGTRFYHLLRQYAGLSHKAHMSTNQLLLCVQSYIDFCMQAAGPALKPLYTIKREQSTELLKCKAQYLFNRLGINP